jgi:hypothetical protein
MRRRGDNRRAKMAGQPADSPQQPCLDRRYLKRAGGATENPGIQGLFRKKTRYQLAPPTGAKSLNAKFNIATTGNPVFLSYFQCMQRS